MDLIAVAGIGLIASAAAVLLRQYKPEYAMVVSLAAAGLIFGLLVADLIPAFSMMRGLMDRVGFSGEYVRILIKCLGILLSLRPGGTNLQRGGARGNFRKNRLGWKNSRSSSDSAHV